MPMGPANDAGSPRQGTSLMKLRLGYANVAATVALCLAVGGPAIASAQALITGRDVADHTLTGVDIANHSLTGVALRAGSVGSDVFSAAALANLRGANGVAGVAGLAGVNGERGESGPPGADGRPGAGVTTTTATGADVSSYQDLAPLASSTLRVVGDYVIFASVTVHNTGTIDDNNFGCGLFSGDNQIGGGTISVAAGATATNLEAGVTVVSDPQTVTLKCESGAATTYDLSHISMRIHDLG